MAFRGFESRPLRQPRLFAMPMPSPRREWGIPRFHFIMRSDPSWQDLVRRAEAEIQAMIGALPEELREEIRELPVVLEPEPSEDMISDGIEPDTLGLFVGVRHPDAESGVHYLPAQILLFLDNIWSYAQGNPKTFRRELRTTYVHEIGHYLGLEEEDLFERGIE